MRKPLTMRYVQVMCVGSNPTDVHKFCGVSHGVTNGVDRPEVNAKMIDFIQ